MILVAGMPNLSNLAVCGHDVEKLPNIGQKIENRDPNKNGMWR